MRIKKTQTKNTVQYAIIYDITTNGKRTTKVYENLGTLDKIKILSKGEDPEKWLDKHLKELNEKYKENTLPVSIKKYPNKRIASNVQASFNCGYLFLEKIFYLLGIDNICNHIKEKYSFKYDLTNIMQRLLYSRILYPSSKKATNELSKNYIEQPKFELHQIYRALEVIAKENDFIQSEIYKNSAKISTRNTGILYYDCTNFFFEIEQEDGKKKYGKSKENRPNPIIEMGLFMDADGIPLAFNITSGNTNEQITMTPTEEKIIKEYNLSKFVVCTDAGLASNANRKFNNVQNRAFITTQSLKKIKNHIRDWALDNEGWHLQGCKNTFTIQEINENEEQYYYKIFYKERWIKENGIEQKLIVTYSIKYKNYQSKIRNNQIERAQKVIDNGGAKLEKSNQNDYKRFIKKINVTNDGEVAEGKILSINTEQIEQEAKFDGFYAVCTNLEDETEKIIDINRKRWEIEESFRIMKSEFKARPVFLQKDDRILAHFTTCFLSLILYRYLEKALDEKYTCEQLIETIKSMTLYKVNELGYIPTYTRNEITDALHDKFGFQTDLEIIKNKNIKKILDSLKK